MFDKDHSLDYTLILSYMIEKLDKEDYENNSLPLIREASLQYSSSEPSIKVQSAVESPLCMYDIETENQVTDNMASKWKSHAEACSILYLIIPKELEQIAEEACKKVELKNYKIIPFQFIKNGPNRDVMIDFPQ